MQKNIREILSRIDKAVSSFQSDIPALQVLILQDLQPLLKKLELRGDRILNRLDNLKLLMEIRRTLQKVVDSPAYKKAVEEFIQSFTDVANLQLKYFALFSNRYNDRTTQIIKEMAVRDTIDALLGQGMNVNVLGKVEKIILQNITSGGSYSSLQDQLRDHLLDNKNGEGALVRYTKQITTDAIHQYNAQYHEAIAQDLQFNWGRYVGSNLETTREFCERLTSQEWVHRKELHEIIKGNIQGVQVKLSKTTQLPLGMIPGTDESNFKIRRGGYNCGHQFFWVPDSAVPLHVRNKKGGNKTKPVSSAFDQINNTLKPSILKALETIDSVHDDGVLKKIPVNISYSEREIGVFRRYLDTNEPIDIKISKYADGKELVFIHEVGHYLDLYAIGKSRTSFGSQTEEMPEVMKALYKSDSIVAIQEKQKTKVSADLAEYFEYLLRPREMWARAYAQYIATRSQDPKLLKQLQETLAETVAGLKIQWDKEEFEEIATAIDELFSRLGWR